MLALTIQTGLRISELAGAHPSRRRRSPPAPTCTPSERAERSDARRSCGHGAVLKAWLHERPRSTYRPAVPDEHRRRASAATPSNAGSLTTLGRRRDAARRSRAKRVTMHTLRHTAAMRLLLAGNDVTVIALWLGHEQIATTNIYLHADMTHKQQAIDRTEPLAAKPGRYRPPDALLAFLEAL